MAERFVYHKGGKIARKDLSSGSLYFDGNSFASFSMPSSDGNYVLRINNGKPEYVTEEAAPLLDSDVYPSNFQNDNVSILTKPGMIPVMLSTEKWNTFQLTSDTKSIISYTNGKWETIPANVENVLGFTIDDSYGYVLSNSASGITKKKVDNKYLYETLGVPNNAIGLMAYSNRSHINISLPNTNGLYGVKFSENKYSTEAITINNIVSGINSNKSGLIGINNGNAVQITGDIDSSTNICGIVKNNDSIALKQIIKPVSFNRLSTNVTIENTDIPLNELFNNFNMNTQYNNVLINFTIVIHLSDTALFDDLNTDAFFSITDGKYTYDSYYLRNPLTNTLTIKFSFVVNTLSTIQLRCNNIPDRNATIVGNVGILHAMFF